MENALYKSGKIDLFHGLNILLLAFKFARERGLTGKFERRKRIIYTVTKGLYNKLLLIY